MNSILLVHNFYQEAGGEDQVFSAEKALLTQHGHQVAAYTRSNHEVGRQSSLKTALDTFWSRQTMEDLHELIKTAKPSIGHFHNTFPLISPSAYTAMKSNKIPVVQTLHNYRLFCANALLLRGNNICEKCIGKRLAWPALIHACYRNDYSATAVAVAAYGLHRLLNTWIKQVDVFIALSEFAKTKFVSAGMPRERIVVKPNFVFPDPGYAAERGNYFLFVGRLAPEKGIETLIDAWSRIPGHVLLKVIGAGPLAAWLTERCAHLPNIEYVGAQTRLQVMEYMKRAKALIVPSQCYENFPMVVAEAYATGTAVIAADNGALAELVQHQQTGLKYAPGSSEALVEQIEWLLEHSQQAAQLRKAAREEFEMKYTAARNYQSLLTIYEQARRYSKE